MRCQRWLSLEGRTQRPRSSSSYGPIRSHLESDKLPRPITAPDRTALNQKQAPCEPLLCTQPSLIENRVSGTSLSIVSDAVPKPQIGIGL